MSMEIHVLFRGKLPSKAALQKTMRELGFPFSIKPATGSLEQQKGYMPMLFGGEETGAEFDVYDGREAVEEIAGEDINPHFDRVASFRWGADERDGAAALCSAAALANILNGMVFEEHEGRALTVEQAIGLAKPHFERLAKSEAAARPGTRPADIKRYLKPLLRLRSDLVLRGRLLLIRPVRHIMRGVLLDRTSDKYAFRVYPYLNLLYDSPRSVSYCNPIHETAWKVYEPYFEPLLLDVLAEDIFARLGALTSLEDFAESLVHADRYQDARVLALILAGRHQQAAQIVDEIDASQRDNYVRQNWVKGQRAVLDRDISALCAECHAREAATAKALKLGDLWEPCLFPVELPEAQRTKTGGEPPFAVTPWVSRPPGLWQEAPDQTGDVRYAVLSLTRNERQILWGPLTREQAEARHANREDFVLSSRMPEGVLLVLRHTTFWSPHDPDQPKNPDYVPPRHFYLDLYGTMGRMTACFDERYAEPGILKLTYAFLVPSSSTSRTWQAYNDFSEQIKDIRASNHGLKTDKSESMTKDDVRLLRFDMPPLHDFEDFFGRVSSYLQNEGFGRFQ
jgi:hypothetical protein